MKTKHENIALIEAWLDRNNLEVEMNDDFVRLVYDEVLEQLYSIKDKESVKQRQRAYTLQYEFVRRDLLKIKYKRNGNSAKGIKEGFVYAIGNPAWGDFVKVGSAIDVIDRLGSYQTSSPNRDYYVIDYFCTYDRLETERNIHDLFDRNSEWCKTTEPEIKEIFKKLKAKNAIEVLQGKLYAVKIALAKSAEEMRIAAEICKKNKQQKRNDFAKRLKSNKHHRPVTGN